MLNLKSIQKTFFPKTPNEVRALRNINFTIEKESFVVVIGSNGSGKSTMQNAVAGTILPDSGSIELADKKITYWSEHKRARLIGRVFQNPFSGTAPHMTLAENLALAVKRGQRRGLGLCLRHSMLTGFQDRIRELNMGLEDRLNNPIGTLSGGQRQALTLFMATMRRPELLLLDEHTAALDPKSAEQIILLTDQVVREKKLTTLMVTHSMQQAASLGDRLIMMHRGEIVADISGDEKRRIRPADLMDYFDDLRRRDLLDETAALMLSETYS
jgi:putative tryptophan/tyrosine transport system ATP-binding protein